MFLRKVEERGETESTEPTEATTFWSGTWSEEVSHSTKASWQEDIKQEVSTTEMQGVEDISNGVNKMAN